ncbi:MAG: L-lactate dehydrogenase, partial [Anaerotignum sp.]
IVLHDEKQIMPASAELCGEYGETDVFVGVPCVIGKNGVEEVVELSLNDAEKAEFKKSCDVIRGNIKFVEENK